MTTNSWHSLFLTSNAPGPDRSAVVADAMRTAAQGIGYTLYNPFGIIPGRSYAHTIRAFVFPVRDGWVRVLSDTILPGPVVAAAANGGFCLSVALTDTDNDIRVYQDGQAADDPASALQAYLQPGANPDDIQRALHAPDLTVLPAEDTPQAPMQEVVLPLDALPEDIQRMAKGMKPEQASRMFNKMMGQFGKGSEDAQRKQAQELMKQAQGLDWSTPSAQQVRLLMRLITVPDDWRKPDFVTLRDAYSLHARRQRRPNARMYPGDAESIAAVPDALAYHPVYAGKDE